jgi:glycosyltransferase involved in cell wall biosynthesis
MSRSRGCFLLVIRSGPVWSLEAGLGHFARAFGSAFDGEIVTRSGRAQRVRAGRFSIWSLPAESKWLPKSLLGFSYICRVVMRGLRLRWWSRRRLVVISYDPFHSGTIGLFLRWLAGAIFVCEVNGVYWDPNTFIDIDDCSVAKRKRLQMIGIGNFVLRRAHFIKMLYPGQLDGFQLPNDSPPREWFHDLVDVHAFTPTERRPEQVLIFIGHPFLLKGVDILLKAFARLTIDFPDWRLLVVGWRIKERADAMAFSTAHVEFLGPQPPALLRELMERSSAVVLPSRSEAMGRVLLEAAFLARPRIGSTAGGIPYFIQDGTDGLLFKSGSVDELVDVLRYFMSAASAVRCEMGKAARARALQQFSADEYVRRYSSIIHRLVAGGE